MRKKIVITGSIVCLLIGIAVMPTNAQMIPTAALAAQEATALETFMNDVERIATESTTFSQFGQKLQDLCLKSLDGKFPVIQELVTKLLQLFFKQSLVDNSPNRILDLLERYSANLNPNYFVLSYGAYHRLNPRKENSINRFKERLSMWRYSDAATFVKGKTLILERQPFGIHQKVVGPQIGLMRGFKGIYLDIESKLTGNAYVFFIGRVHRIRAFDLTPLSK